MQEFFDDGFPPGEQIPRCVEVMLTAEPGPFGEVVRMTVNRPGRVAFLDSAGPLESWVSAQKPGKTLAKCLPSASSMLCPFPRLTYR